MTPLIYGANGYTGELIAEQAVKRGHRPILAGRSAASILGVARKLNLEARVFPLDSPPALDKGLNGVAVVLHCAGPFSRTSRPMVDACIRNRAHYLDITGEAAVFETCAARDAEAKSAGVMLLPGSGFDVVPSDCLAAHLKSRLPEATHLSLGFQAPGSLSRGTALTLVENMSRGGLVRREGRLVRVPAAWKTRTIDFGRGPTKAVTIPWGDVATAFHSTRIPNIEVYLAAPFGVRATLRLTRPLGPLLALSSVQELLKRRVRARPPGPSAERRARGISLLWGEATDRQGRRVVSRLRTPEGYTLTAFTSVAIVERVLHGEAPPGYQTPSSAFGADFILSFEGVARSDEA